MMRVDDIVAPVSKEMEEFETRFRESLASKVPMLDKVTHYVVRRKGKQMRPLFVFLTSKMLGDVNDKTYEAATLIELLHTATLVHDDVVDDANERRGFFSVNALWKNKIAVLVGDYMLSKILILSIEKENTDILGVVARAVKEMSEGELLQIEKARRLDITEEVYYEVIRQKTASLISSACEAAALSQNRSEERDHMRKFGELIGTAFQIKDDIFDYGDPGNIGKPTGLDIRERKMTLPLIFALNNSDKATRSELINIIKNHNENPKKVKHAVELVIKAGGIAYAHQQMLRFRNEALTILERYPDSDAKRSLIGLVEYTTERTK